MFRKILLTGCAALAFGGTALAADLPVTIPALPPAPERFSWTGFYAGANIGYGWGGGDVLYVGDAQFLSQVVGVGLIPPSYDVRPRGLLGGLQIGYNHQIDQLVLGIELDGQLARIRGSIAAAGADPGVPPVFTTSATAYTNLDWFVTLRGRLGFASDRTLFYLTGGLMLAKPDVGGTFGLDFDIPVLMSSQSGRWAGAASDTRLGWTIGGGVEWAFEKDWSLKLEYLYYNLGDIDVTLAPLNADAVGFGFVPVQRHEINGHIARIGLNYHF